MVIFLTLFMPFLVFAAPTTEDTAPVYTKDALPFDPTQAAQIELKYHAKEQWEAGRLSTIWQLDLGSADPLSITLNIINIVLTFLASGFLILLMYAGVLWMIARGNQEQIDKSKKIIQRAVIGLIIVLGALSISSTIFYFIEPSFQEPEAETP
ncbi:MAG: pilin [bacterium]|nr:pilin [bacterium]